MNTFIDTIQSLGCEWKQLDEEGLNTPRTAVNSKYRNRMRSIKLKYYLLSKYLPEYKDRPKRKVLDFSCGNGVSLEILREWGHDIFGVDIQYEAFLKSQKIPYMIYDCSKLPYPFEDKSFDLIMNLGAITFYPRINNTWEDIIDEFARISRKTIFMVVNKGWLYDKHIHYLDNWRSKEWKRVVRNKYIYKWERK
jgi:SAM-dependent methyltransferase